MAPLEYGFDAHNGPIQQGALLSLLSNNLILNHTVPYLSISALLNLSATSRSFRELTLETPSLFRHLDLTEVKTAQFEIDGIDHGGETWRNVQVDENLTEDDFYSGPLRGIFSSLNRADILKQVQTLVLDGLAVTAELVHDIIIDPSYNVRVLSLRDVKHLNERSLCGALSTACRRGRPPGTPRLKALYIFGPSEQKIASSTIIEQQGTAAAPEPSNAAAIGTTWNERSQAVLTSLVAGDNVGQGDAWYARRGKMVTRTISEDWAATMLDCRGIIAFDAVLCKGPWHYNSPALGKIDLGRIKSPFAPGTHRYAAAVYSLSGCEGCGTAPEGWTTWGETVDEDQGGELGAFPLLAPPPLHSSNVRVAMCPSGQSLNPSRYHGSWSKTKPSRFIARCYDCVRDRYCWSCHKWWCEDCYPGPPEPAPPMINSDLKVRADGTCGECWANKANV
ncbi:uncharacterized protein E0L32_002526 [Thyridium curvatum]|uniref:Uncharacterized protein n=1 Tax=Thyridium curvatum TaxID=1093900 RepID=A0A507BMD9_9PEZI|nr:uncharacterized protein E0L32_002526 [Thyridium curvatum]TPX18669.1 hypothetical protein E0L32_002526 [Thyridium curvatum]